MEFLIASRHWGVKKNLIGWGGSGGPLRSTAGQSFWVSPKIFGRKLAYDLPQAPVIFWILCDAVQKICAGFSKKVKKTFSFFLYLFCPMGKFVNISSQDDAQESNGCYDTTLVANGNCVRKWRGLPFFDFEPYLNMLAW